jgi:hypothetical protein
MTHAGAFGNARVHLRKGHQMKFEIIPLQGVNDIRFGMTPEKVRRLAGADFTVFKRGHTDPHPSDHFKTLGMFCYYDANGTLEAVEFADPARPSIHGVEFLHMPFDAAKSALARLDNQFEEDLDGAIAYRIGVSIWVPLLKDDPSSPVESVLAFRAGSYDQEPTE